MWPVSDAYQEVLAGPHRIEQVADVLVGDEVAYYGLPVTGGSITVSSRQRTRRSCDLTITPHLPISTYEQIPALAASVTGVDGTHPLRWTGPEIHVRRGLRYPSGDVEWVPVGVFRIDGGMGSLVQGSAVQVSGVSRESWLTDDNRSGGVYTTTGGTATSLIRARILATAPGAEILISTRQDRIVPASSADDADAWATVERLAESIGAVAYCDAAGRFIVTDQPNKNTAASSLIRAGVGGTLVTADGGGDRTDVVTGVTVTGATPTGSATPLVGTAYNDDVTSPTRRGDPSTGLFGWAMLHLSDPTLLTHADCQRVAAAELAKRTGALTGIGLSAIPMAHLEALDVIDIATDGDRIPETVSRHVVDSYTLDLAAGGGFSITTRDLGQVTA